jgi:aspartate carbamoyltransferase regulatory subunit
MEKTLPVAAIKNGTVIDHIAAGQAQNIIQILDLTSHKKIVTVGINLLSKAMGRKDLIKIEDKEISQAEADRFAFLAPLATINIIRNYKVIKKFKVTMPLVVDQIIICPNPMCISNREVMTSAFKIIAKGKTIKLQCKYCEKIFDRTEINKYNK